MILSSIPSVDRVLRAEALQPLIVEHGRDPVATAIRAVLAELRQESGASNGIAEDAIVERVRARVVTDARPGLRPVINLTGTILHTNLGRAPLPREAVDAIASVATQPSNLEFDLGRGGRGERDDHAESLLCRLTGAEAATVVNNNAAAVLLVLNTLARGKEVPTSRGELIEIGGAFRMPEIMARAGCRLREIGTTNRVHRRDYEEAIGPRTALVMKVHTSNYAIVGFTTGVAESDLAALCRERHIPLVVDLGSGTLVDLRRYGLPHEPTPMESLRAGADLVTFSGDKLLGGPQAGIIVGRADLIGQLRRNPMKRALRVDKLTMAALVAVLSLYLDPERLAARLPVVRLLTRPLEDIRAQAERVRPAVSAALGSTVGVEVVECVSEVGSGALPTHQIPSAGLAIRPATARGGGKILAAVTAAFRGLPVPVIGRTQEGAFILDLRCLDDEPAFVKLIGSGINVGWAST